MDPLTLSEEQRERLERACCMVQALRDLLQPEIAAKVAPFGPLLKPASDALEFGCPLEPKGGRQEVELTGQQVEWVKESSELAQALLRVAEASPDYAPVGLLLTFICRDLSSI